MKQVNSKMRDGYYLRRYDGVYQRTPFKQVGEEDLKLMQGVFRIINRSINENRNLIKDVVEEDYETSKLL